MEVVSFVISWGAIVGVFCVFLVVRSKKQKVKTGGGSDSSDSGSRDYNESSGGHSCDSGGGDSGGDCGGGD